MATRWPSSKANRVESKIEPNSRFHSAGHLVHDGPASPGMDPQRCVKGPTHVRGGKAETWSNDDSTRFGIDENGV